MARPDLLLCVLLQPVVEGAQDLVRLDDRHTHVRSVVLEVLNDVLQIYSSNMNISVSL